MWWHTSVSMLSYNKAHQANTPNTIKIKQGCPNWGIIVSTSNTKYQHIPMLWIFAQHFASTNIHQTPASGMPKPGCCCVSRQEKSNSTHSSHITMESNLYGDATAINCSFSPGGMTHLVTYEWHTKMELQSPHYDKVQLKWSCHITY